MCVLHLEHADLSPEVLEHVPVGHDISADTVLVAHEHAMHGMILVTELRQNVLQRGVSAHRDRFLKTRRDTIPPESIIRTNIQKQK